MTKFIYSKSRPKILLHIVYKTGDILEERTDIVPHDQFLQLAILNLEKGRRFKPHRHIFFDKQTKIAQESWVVIMGKISVKFYDIDDVFLEEYILYPGDLSITLYGGHEYTSLEDNTVVYEYKTGPYFGIDKDKIHIRKVEEND